MLERNLRINGLKAAVFDWDNTLAESRSSLVCAIDKVLPEYGLPQWEIVKERRDNNLSFRDNFSRIFGDKAQEAYAKYVKIYKQIVGEKISSFPKVCETLEFFKHHQVAVMIMTNKDRELLEYELPMLFNPKLFDNIVCGHEAKKDKPCAEHLFFTVKGFLNEKEVSTDTVWVVGDSPQDSNCAQSSGARAIRIGKSIWQEEEDDDMSKIDFYQSFADFYDKLLKDNA